MRRLFSNFASGLPALGLLLIRIVAGTSLVIDGWMTFHVGQPILPSILSVLEFGAGAMLVAGIWTPLAGLLAVLLSVSAILIRHGNLSSNILLAAMGAALALVGPGALSVDAWIFGLKRIDIDKLNGSSR